jgi:organic radical activating enzyme
MAVKRTQKQKELEEYFKQEFAKLRTAAVTVASKPAPVQQVVAPQPIQKPKKKSRPISMSPRRTYNKEPNYSIVMPGACQGNCSFCFWEKMKTTPNYLDKLMDTINILPPEFRQMSITGGEPLISPFFPDLMARMKKDKAFKTNFPKVVLTSNGGIPGKTFVELAKSMKGVVDHVNISRHHYDEATNASIFASNKIINNADLKLAAEALNKVGIDVTFNCVLTDHIATKQDVLTYINFARLHGATAVAFRKQHGTLEPSELEKKFKEYTGKESHCPVCRSNYMTINGMSIVWKCSSTEPSEDVDDVYELISHPNGGLTEDWGGKKEIVIDEEDGTMMSAEGYAKRLLLQGDEEDDNGTYVSRHGCGGGGHC